MIARVGHHVGRWALVGACIASALLLALLGWLWAVARAYREG